MLSQTEILSFGILKVASPLLLVDQASPQEGLLIYGMVLTVAGIKPRTADLKLALIFGTDILFLLAIILRVLFCIVFLSALCCSCSIVK